MERFPQLVIFLSVFLLFSAYANAHVKSLIIFGDSLFDPGNNRYIKNCTIQANFPPYGSTFFHRPTGRFSNGRTVADFIAQHMGIKFQKPYQKLYGKNLGSIIVKHFPVQAHGINFASAGSGILPETNKYAGVTPLEVQLQQFQELIHYKHLHRDQISKSIFFLEAGSNDIFTYLQAPEKSTLSPIAFVDSMLREAANFLDIIYQHGARKIAIFSVGPMGCIPGRINLPNASTHRCYAGANKMTKYYNYGLERLVYSIRRKYRGAIGVYGEVFNTAQRLRVRPKLHGFSNVNSACCGAGPLKGRVQCGEKGYTMCSNANEYFYWDYFHPSEHTYELISKALWSGGRYAIRPINLRTLANITLPHS
ncbi:GDSL esterase/lipase 6 [Lactuca sativa]|uniref:Uncharacterized protein n=1 Tax=Lactuca sativa TaxID=4236 RepID=A0A9R1WYK9_LACSA|nr:GDSL esterase/lipase 6 [Lactuca sativa]KAJ0191499.1 hypothetical protein LSAT_V11C800405730 [Lactuca sativa]